VNNVFSNAQKAYIWAKTTVETIREVAHDETRHIRDRRERRQAYLTATFSMGIIEAESILHEAEDTLLRWGQGVVQKLTQYNGEEDDRLFDAIIDDPGSHYKTRCQMIDSTMKLSPKGV
jgi:hypothetical protein